MVCRNLQCLDIPRRWSPISAASHEELIQKGGAANKGLQSLIQMLESSEEETQENAASVLADVFGVRKYICENIGRLEIINPLIKLLNIGTKHIAMQSARATAALFSSTETKKNVVYNTSGAFKPLIELGKSSSISAAEMAINALANLLSYAQIAEQGFEEDIIPSLSHLTTLVVAGHIIDVHCLEWLLVELTILLLVGAFNSRNVNNTS